MREMFDGAHRAFTSLLDAQPRFRAAVADGYLAADSFPIEDRTGAVALLAQTLRERNVSEIRLSAGVSREEVAELAVVLSESPESLEQQGGIRAVLAARQVTHIQMRERTRQSKSRTVRDPADAYEGALSLTEETLRAVQSGLQISLAGIKGAVSDCLQNLMSDAGVLCALAGIRSYDRYLSEHSVNVSIFSMALGRDLGLDGDAAIELGIAAMLHDVGKVFVPSQVVKKPGRLTEEEWEQLRRHPLDGARALVRIPDLPPLAATIALEHHAYGDGSGYPSLPSDCKPHLLSRLVAIVDTYDALTTDRPYRRRWTPREAVAWMVYESHDRYDRELLARFAARMGVYPPGCLVRLASGELAAVVSGSRQHPDRPVLKIISVTDETQSRSRLVDLSANLDPAMEISAVARPVEALLPIADRLAA